MQCDKVNNRNKLQVLREPDESKNNSAWGGEAVAMVWSTNAGSLSGLCSWKWREAESLSH